jgi:hypothetical protein
MHTLLNIVTTSESKRPHDNMLPLYNKIQFSKICYSHINMFSMMELSGHTSLMKRGKV